MSNEAGIDQPKDHEDGSTIQDAPLKDSPKQTLLTDCQEYVHNRKRGRKKGVIEVEGKVVGRDEKIVPSADVFKLAAIGCKDIEIAEWFGIDSNIKICMVQFDLEQCNRLFDDAFKPEIRQIQWRISTRFYANNVVFIW